MRKALIAAVVLVVTAPLAAHATMIYTNPWNAASGDAGAFSRADQRLAQEFALGTPAVASRATWYGTMFAADPLDTGDTWSFDVYFRSDSGGLPGAVYANAAVTALVTDTGTDVQGERAYLFDALFSPVVLGSGVSYWFSVENTGLPNTFRWTEATGGSTSAISFSGNPWQVWTEEGRTPLNFSLLDDAAPVPEPSTLLLLGAGLLAGGRRLRSRRP